MQNEENYWENRKLKVSDMSGMLIDEKDKSILKLLIKNARTPISEIVERTKILKDTVAYRMKRLLDGGLISGYAATINPRLLGYQYFGVVLIRFEPVPESELVEFQKKLAAMKNITHINKTIGQYDMVLYIVARDAINFGEIINEIKNTDAVASGKKIIQNIDTLNIIHELKVDNFSGLI